MKRVLNLIKKEKPRSERLTKKTRAELKAAVRDASVSPTFKDPKEAIRWLNS